MALRVVILFCALLGFFPMAVFSAKMCPGTATYTITFYSNWSNTTHPNAYPFSPKEGRFSPLIGCSHSGDYAIFSTSIKATQGVKDVAETGNKTVLEEEINHQISTEFNAWDVFSETGPLIPPNMTKALSFQVTSDFSKVSAISMIAPSPDWFIGISSFDLCDDDGEWMDSYEMSDLQPWDAGTDNGTEFGSEDGPLIPAVNIFRITKSDNTSFRVFSNENAIPSLGKITLTRTNKPAMTPSCSGEVTYKLKFEALWSAETHPTGFPSGAHFSALIGATHKYPFEFWSKYVRASDGVKKVAETGESDTLKSEIEAKKPAYVYEVFTGNAINPSPGEEELEIKVKDEFSRVSFISMIAPSPDWFVGVDSADLCNAEGKWKTEYTMSLSGWDAGTDSGTAFTSSDNATNPVDVIRMITGDSNTILEGADFAKVTLTKTNGSSPSGAGLTFLLVAFVGTLGMIM